MNSSIPDEMDNIISSFTMKIVKAEDEYIRNVVPTWYIWAVERGGIFKKVAQFFVKVIVIEKGKIEMIPQWKVPKKKDAVKLKANLVRTTPEVSDKVVGEVLKNFSRSLWTK